MTRFNPYQGLLSGFLNSRGQGALNSQTLQASIQRLMQDMGDIQTRIRNPLAESFAQQGSQQVAYDPTGRAGESDYDRLRYDPTGREGEAAYDAIRNAPRPEVPGNGIDDDRDGMVDTDAPTPRPSGDPSLTDSSNPVPGTPPGATPAQPTNIIGDGRDPIDFADGRRHWGPPGSVWVIGPSGKIEGYRMNNQDFNLGGVILTTKIGTNDSSVGGPADVRTQIPLGDSRYKSTGGPVASSLRPQGGISGNYVDPRTAQPSTTAQTAINTGLTQGMTLPSYNTKDFYNTPEGKATMDRIRKSKTGFGVV